MLYSLHFACTKLYGINFQWTLHKAFGDVGDNTTNFDIKNRKLLVYILLFM